MKNTRYKVHFSKMYMHIFGQLLQVTVHPTLRDHCPACNVGALWPNGWMDQNATWYGSRPRPRQHCAKWGPSSPLLHKGAQQPPLYYVYSDFSNCWALVTNYHKLVFQSLKHLNTATSTLASRFDGYPHIAVTTQASTPTSRLRLRYIHAVKDLLVG